MDWQAETERRVAKGVALFKQGYNCSQAVTLAFADWYGGGIGRMRETCGTASGMFMLAGLEIASEEANQEVKAKNYRAVQKLAAMFKEQTGSLICRELLTGYVVNVNVPVKVSTDPTPEARTDEYYKKRPCVKMVELAIRTYMNFLEHDKED